MIEPQEITTIQDFVQEMLRTMTIVFFNIDVVASPHNGVGLGDGFTEAPVKDLVDINIKLQEPQLLIGQGGQTLQEFQRVLRIALNKKLHKYFYVALDINDYRRNKETYLRDLAQSSADEVVFTKKSKELPVMSSYERRIVHAILAARSDVTTESHGEGMERHITVSPRLP